MKTIILHILCEGQTEDKFVNDVLHPYLQSFNIVCKHQILLTNKQKNCRGGISSYSQVKRDLTIMLKQFKDSKNEEHWFTTMIDFYGLPADFPSYNDEISDIYSKIQSLETAYSNDITNPRFIPYIQLHEYEALVFTGLDYLKEEYPCSSKLEKCVIGLKKVLQEKQDNPELINTKKAPSKYIIDSLDGLHKYNKPKVGSSIASKVGIEKLKTQCKHFGEWISILEKLGMLT